MPFKKNKNRRQKVRILICRLAKIQVPDHNQNKKMAQVFDLSEAGMLLHVIDLSSDAIQFVDPGLKPNPTELKNPSRVKLGDTLFFSLGLDPEHSEIKLSGRVAWIKRVTNARQDVYVHVGIEFINVSDMDRKLIQVYVAALKS